MFEVLCLYFLRHDKFYASRFSDVWLWNDWPGNEGHRDTGIDIVAEIMNSGTYCAIQCKFHEQSSTITKGKIDSFISASSKNIFSERILISLYGNLSKHAAETLEDQNIPARNLTLHDLENSSIDWSAFNPSMPDYVRYLDKNLRDDQKDAVDAVINSFTNHDRGKLIMACGTGKTFTSLNIAETIAGSGGKVLFLVPSISLLSQTVIAWNNDRFVNIKMISFAVCSDKTAGRVSCSIYPEEDARISELLIPPTTDSNALISEWQKVSEKDKRESMTVIFSTYQSLNVIHDAQTKGFPEFDIVICDEAHRTSNSQDSTFTLIHDDAYVKSKKRLYMTATPKIYTEQKSNPIWSMDNEEIFGPEFFKLSFSEAVSKNLLSDYKVIIIMTEHDKPSAVMKALAMYQMKSAAAFTNTIAASKEFSHGHYSNDLFSLDVNHVDGNYPASERSRLLEWLAAPHEDNTCRILSNARCLCEGVDVPALDAVIFMASRKSEIDIVQSVGRVMRKSQGKKFGYVILPVIVPPSVKPDEALNNNESYKSVWQVLQALRSHDDNFRAVVNSLDLNEHSEKIIVIPPLKNEIDARIPNDVLEEWFKAISSRIVKKCGDSEYWQEYIKSLAEKSTELTQKFRDMMNISNRYVNDIFTRFFDGLRENINAFVKEDEAIQMLAHHIAVMPVFNELFPGFSHDNPVSEVMQKTSEELLTYNLNINDRKLNEFYEHVRGKVKAIHDDRGRQKLIRIIYERFFKLAFKETSEKLGIVYTPEEAVDFILKSVQWAVTQKLSQPEGLSSKNVHILDPFSGTGTFTARLIQSGLIDRSALKEKYSHGIHANEILLLAYYISAINIESSYHSVTGEYSKFRGILLTDTFTLKGNRQKPILFSEFYANGLRAYEQDNNDCITVIIGNPPYNVGRKESYAVDELITASYAKESKAANKNSLYDSYIRAIKWASQRIRNGKGVICFITNASFIDSNSADGMRKCLREEFSAIYIFNLRGNQYTQGEISRKEGGKIFGSGSRLPVAITLFVKDDSKEGCEIHYYSAGDYMTREEKLKLIESRVSFGEMMREGIMTKITPNNYGDWVNKRNETFGSFMRLGSKNDREILSIFEDRYSKGVQTSQDALCFNFSKKALLESVVKVSVE